MFYRFPYFISSFSLVLVLAFLGTNSSAVAAGCFTRHVVSAARSNEERMPVYAQLSGGKSIPISQKLISSEKTAVWVARYFDFRARRYERAGVHLICDGFVSMNKVPPVQTSLNQTSFGVLTSPSENSGVNLLTSFVQVDAQAIKSNIKNAYSASGFLGIQGVIGDELNKLSNPKFNCMLRHTLESIKLFAVQAEPQARLSLAKGLPASQKLSWQIIKSHLLALSEIIALDEMAAPLQNRGIAILCGDVPPIPIY